MREIVDEVLKTIGSDESVVGDKALPLEDGQSPVPISEDNFEELPEPESSRVSFIDGGNAELFGATNFSLQLLRGAVVTYEGTEKKDKRKEDFYLLITFSDEEFSVKTFPDGRLPDLKFDSMDPNLRTGNERVVAQRVAGVCRRLFELRLASEAAGDSDIVVLDGDLQARTTHEEPLLRELKESGATICGLSKTSGLLTEKGRVFSAAISTLGEGSWSYRPVFKGGDVFVSFAKLHPDSKHVFRFDLFYEKDVEDVLASLIRLSRDAVFIGYPYGLIEADKTARVSNNDKDYLRTKLMTQFGKEWKNVKTYLHTRDAHEILDNVG